MFMHRHMFEIKVMHVHVEEGEGGTILLRLRLLPPLLLIQQQAAGPERLPTTGLLLASPSLTFGGRQSPWGPRKKN